VSRYAASLTRALDTVCRDFPGLAFSLLTTRAGAAKAEPANIPVRVVGRGLEAFRMGPGRVALEQLAVPRRWPGIVHFFDLSGPLLAPSQAFVTTVHDAAVAHGYNRARYAYKRRLHPWALKRAQLAVAVSEFAKGEAMQHYGADPARIRVVRSGPGLIDVAAPDEAGPVGSGPPTFLYVGNLTASKNLAFLVSAFEQAGVDGELTLAGRPGEHFAELRERVNNSPLRGRIRIVQGADDDQVDGLYRSATALVHPSQYEGFGFTPLEAMARGCPVLAGDIPAVREISGSGAMLLPLDDIESWTHALRRVLTDASLREELRARGLRTAARYSWNETAKELCELFLDLAARATAPR
jgi:glycosyltransferase involved in cell wall biosynthesis